MPESQNFQFSCPKCACPKFELSELANSSNEPKTLVSCTDCAYSEIFNLDLSTFKQRNSGPTRRKLLTDISPKPTFQFTCSKCAHKEYDLVQHLAEVSSVVKFLSFAGRATTLVVCKKCRYADVYQIEIEEFKQLHNIT